MCEYIIGEGSEWVSEREKPSITMQPKADEKDEIIRLPIPSSASSFSITHCSSLSSCSHRGIHLPCKRSNKQKKTYFPIIEPPSLRFASSCIRDKMYKAFDDEDFSLREKGIIFPLQNQAARRSPRLPAHKQSRFSKSITFLFRSSLCRTEARKGISGWKAKMPSNINNEVLIAWDNLAGERKYLSILIIK